MGTAVMAGHGAAVVTETGMRTEMGAIAGMLGDVKEEPTPLQKRLATLGTFVAVTCIACGVVVAGIGLWRGGKLLDMLLTGISLAVAAIPEGLPAIVTIVLALSVNRILKHGAIIRKLHAVETLGSASVICSDKTGTITENRMTVTEIFCAGELFHLKGGAAETTGGVTRGGASVRPADNESLDAALTAAVLCASSRVTPEGNKLAGQGNPTEIALLCAAYRCGYRRETLEPHWQVVAEKPFDSGRKMMSVQVRYGDRKLVMVKGAPDLLLGRCTHIGTADGVRPLLASDRARLLNETDRMAENAMRVIAVATRAGAHEETELTFLALFGMMDPPRKEVKNAVRVCRLAGIRPVMITGDYALTARAVARIVGILQPGDCVLEGHEIDRMSDRELQRAVKRVSVFARVSPKHKLRIVRAYKQNGHIVAMTGDGVNDAPAVKEADIGVAMGIAGSDVTKEASSVVVLDDNFATIVAAVEEGRIIYKNIKRFIRFLLTSNLGEVLTIVLAMLIDVPAIFIPIQILLINLVTDGLPAIALGMEGATKDIMKEPPRPESEGLFANGLTGAILFRGAVLGLCNVLSYVWVWNLSSDVLVARSAVFLTLILAQMLLVLECKAEGVRRFSEMWNNRMLNFACLISIAVSLGCVYLPLLQGLFGTAAVTGNNLLPVLVCVLITQVLGFIGRQFRKRQR